MTDYDDTNKGVLFDEKEIKSDKHPAKTGKLNVEGKEYRIAAWEKESRNGDTFLSLAISEPKIKVPETGIEQARAKANQLRKPDVVAEMDGEPINLNDIPF